MQNSIILRIFLYKNLVKRHKYGAKKTVVDGITFDSKKEAARYQELKLLEQAGEISNLELQPEYEVIITKKYKADFLYTEKGKTIVEDVKGFKTPEYITKRKFFRKQYPHLEHRET